jgi:hypothetical protein
MLTAAPPGQGPLRRCGPHQLLDGLLGCQQRRAPGPRHHGGRRPASFRLNAAFLGLSGLQHGLPRPRSFGTRPGDLSFTAGDGNNDLEMLLFTPGGLSATGDLYGGPGNNTALRTSNLKAHNCQQDNLFGLDLGRLVRRTPFNLAGLLHP